MFAPSDEVLLRDVEGGRVRTARPVTVVADDGETTALALAPGTPIAWVDVGDRANLVRQLAKGGWQLGRREWTDTHVLILLRSGAAYSPQLFQMPAGGVWYVNLQDPPRRTALGFDTTDHLLDLIVGADGSWWQWKDEHELREAVEIGYLSPEVADEIRSTGEAVIDLVGSDGAWWFDWNDWVPDPATPVPLLPEGWDVLD